MEPLVKRFETESDCLKTVIAEPLIRVYPESVTALQEKRIILLVVDIAFGPLCSEFAARVLCEVVPKVKIDIRYLKVVRDSVRQVVFAYYRRAFFCGLRATQPSLRDDMFLANWGWI
jgi:hypothetical protein